MNSVDGGGSRPFVMALYPGGLFPAVNSYRLMMMMKQFCAKGKHNEVSIVHKPACFYLWITYIEQVITRPLSVRPLPQETHL